MSATRNIRRSQWKSNHVKHGKRQVWCTWKVWKQDLQREINKRGAVRITYTGEGVSP